MDKKANSLFLKFKEKLSTDHEFTQREVTRIKYLNAKVLTMTFDEQVKQADYVIQKLIKDSTQDELLEWAKIQAASYKDAIALNKLNATSLANAAALANSLQNSEWKAKYFKFHKKFSTLYKPENF